jgi:replicative DNA helicase
MDNKFAYERGVIAAAIRNVETYPILANIVKPENFRWEPYKDVWYVIGKIYENNLSPDILTISAELDSIDKLRDFSNPGRQITGMAAISEIREVPTTKDAAISYAINIADNYTKRQLVDIMEVTARQCSDENIRAEDALIYLKDRTSSIVPKSIQRTTSITDAADEVYKDIEERSKNPGDVWGIPYAFQHLTQVTGGKQAGELIIVAGEPKVGKSWWVYQDALETAVNHKIPCFIWSGEMKRKQVMRRLYQLYGLNSRRSRTGYMMDADWKILNEAKEIIADSPLYIDDQPMRLDEFYSVLYHEKQEHGIEQFIVDYAMLVNAPGKDEVERTSNVSREMKRICHELNLSGILITSVTKQGMDTNNEDVMKKNIRGSGQQIHDADVVYILTKYAKTNSSDDLFIKPNQYDNIITLHIAAGRELDHHLPNGIIHYERDGESPKFVELKKPENVTTFTPNRYGKD